MLKLRKNKKGFSLVELIVVIAIMAVLAGVVGGTLFSQLNKQKDASAASEALTLVGSLKTAIQADASKDSDFTADDFKTAVDTWVTDNAEAINGNAGAAPTSDSDLKLVKAGSHKFAVVYTGNFVASVVYDQVKADGLAGQTLTYNATTGVATVVAYSGS